ncbi:ABC transporter permease [Streptomyces sp. NPDC047046]|uniref:ABC transporter permease n=1 Tax=Streptomyces sp. NPDC047046 TaxID=3155378 RepID=UPI0033E7057B
MSAPQTPPPAPYDPAQQAPESGGAQVRRGVLLALVLVVLGLAFGALWLWLAPRVPLVADGKAVYLKDSEGEQPIGADGTFALIGLGLGILTGLAVFLWRRAGGAALVLGMAVGALLGSVLAWRLGVWLGPTQDVVAHAKEVGENVTFDAPLKLAAKGTLLAWPLAACVVHLLLTAAFGPRDPSPYGLDAVPAWRSPGGEPKHWPAPGPAGGPAGGGGTGPENPGGRGPEGRPGTEGPGAPAPYAPPPAG